MSRADRRSKARAAARRSQRIAVKRRSGTSVLPPKVKRILAIAAVTALVLGAGAWGVAAYVGGNKVVKTVNGQDITQRELGERTRLLMYLYGLKEIGAETRQYLLDGLVDERLLAAESQKREITASDEDLDRLTQQYTDSLATIYGSTLNITAQRVRLRVTAKVVTDYLRTQITSSKLYAEVVADVEVSEADVEAYYLANKETLDQQGLSLDTARDKLVEDALQEKRGEAYGRFLEELRAAATISSPG